MVRNAALKIAPQLLKLPVQHTCHRTLGIGKLQKEIVNPNMSRSLQSDPLRLTCNHPKMFSIVFPNGNSWPKLTLVLPVLPQSQTDFF